VAFGGLPVLDGIDLRIEAGERLCLVGRNGVGKSTIIRLLAGEIAPDQGEIVRSQGLTTANLPQEVPSGLSGTVFDLVAGGLGRTAEALAEYHRLSAKADDDRLLGRLARLQQTLESDGGWQLHQRVESALTRLGLPPDAEFSNLSAGLKRLALLARALVGQPDILLLDEPTNHLDIGAVARLEEYMLKHPGTVVFVTHDRMLLRRLATRIVEIDRGRLFDWACDYDTFLARKSEALATEAMQEEKFDKKLAEEEAWLRRGIKARRTRNEGRVRALETMRVLREARRERTGTVRMQLHEAEKTGKLGIEATGLGFSYGDRAILRDFSTTIMRGDKVGIIGPNGCGKSTLLRLLLGELPPQQGRIRHGVRLLPAYFDQLRAQWMKPRPCRKRGRRQGHPDHQRPAPTRHRLPSGFPFFTRTGSWPGFPALRRRTEPAAAGQAVRQAVQRPHPGRADQ
jgi:ATP-binding cassette subfamily F protein uup